MFQNLFFSGFPIFECNSEPETGRISCTPPLEKRPIRSNNPARLELCYIFTYYFVPSVQLHETDPIERTDEGTTQEMEAVRRYDDQQWTKLRSVRKMIILSGKMRVRSKMLLNFIKTIIKIIRGENHRWERKMPFKITLCIHTCSNQEKWKNSGKMFYHSGKSFLSIGKVLRYTGKMIDVKEKCLSL
jgi:hypothetical protein